MASQKVKAMILTNSVSENKNALVDVKRSYNKPLKCEYTHSFVGGYHDLDDDEKIACNMGKPNKLTAFLAKAYYSIARNTTAYPYVCAQCGKGSVSSRPTKYKSVKPMPFIQIKGMSCIRCECSTYILLSPYPVDIATEKVLISDFTDNINEATYRPIGIFKAIFRSIKIWNRNLFVFNK